MRRYGRRSRLNRRSRRQFPGVRRTRPALRRAIKGVMYRAAETKNSYQTINIADQLNVPTIFQFSAGIVAGTGTNQRIGRNIKGKRITWKFWNTFTYVSPGGTYAMNRMMLVYPRKGIDDTSLLSELNLITISSSVDPAIAMVLMDKYWAVGAQDTTLPIAKHFSFSKRIRCEFNYDAAGEVKREPILVFVSNLLSANVSNNVIGGYLKLSYKDL